MPCHTPISKIFLSLFPKSGTPSLVFSVYLKCLCSWLLLLFSHSVVSDSLQPRGLQHTRLPCPSPTPGTCSNSCPLIRWCHPTISPSVVPFSCLQSFPASESFPMSHFFASGSQRIGASTLTTVLPMNIQDCFPLEMTGLISLQSKGLPRVFSNTTVQKHQFFGTRLTNYKCFVISWLHSPSKVILEPKKIKSVTVSIFPHLFAMKPWN